MIDSPDSHRPHDHVPGPTRRETATSSTASTWSPGGVPPTLVRRAVRGLRELEQRRARMRLHASRVDVGPVPGLGLVDEAEMLVALLAELRAGTTVQVCALRARGEPPERVLRHVKSMIRNALSAEGWRDPLAVEPLLRRVVQWSIEAYYDR